MARDPTPAARRAIADRSAAVAGFEDTVASAPRDQSDAVRDELAFPSLDGADVQRMEDLAVAKLFPRQAAAVRIGRYTLLDRLGQGGMGIVYAAYDPELDRRVAIKVLTKSLAGQAEARLLREAQAMARVVHANVVSVIEVGRDHGQAFVVMEYLRGLSLDRWAERRAGWRETLRVYVQAGRGLAAAHRAGVIHRDFKPHNAMLVEGGIDDGRVKVLDFGLARGAVHDLPLLPAIEGSSGTLTETLTRTGALMGTPAYMAPEQFAGDPAGERSDQFSFAVSLYEALYGRLPFDATSLTALSQALASGVVRPPPAGTDVPLWVHRVVVRGLALRPGDRHPSIAAMCDALERDPAARRRTIGLSLAFSAVVGAGGWGLAQLDSDAVSPCSGPAFALDEVWSEERAATVDAAFAATGVPHAADTARRVRPIVDAYANAWVGMRRDACEAHQRGEQSAPLLDLRMSCLDRRRAGFGALVELLTHADAPLLERAVEAALALPPLVGCADVAALTSGPPLPAEPERAEGVSATRLELAELGALTGAGRFDEAAPRVEAALARAGSLNYQPLIAEAALALGSVELERRRGQQAEQALTRAVLAGIEGRADRVVAEALSRRMYVRAVVLGESVRALADDALVAAHAARFPADGALQWLAANNRGAVASTAHDLVRARELYTAALAVEDGPTPLDLARTRYNLGSLEFDVLDFGAALAAYRAAVVQASEALGSAHPLVNQLRIPEAMALSALGRRREARQQFEAVLDHPELGAGAVWPLLRLSQLDSHYRDYETARARARRALELTDVADVITLINAETALAYAVATPAEAQPHYENILRRAEATYGEVHAFTATCQRHVAGDMIRRGRAEAALPMLREALVTSEKLHGADSALTAETRCLLADALLALNQPQEALAAAGAAVTTFASQPGDHALDLVLARRTLGRAQLAAAQAPAAVETLRAALALAEARLDPDDPDLAATQFELGRAAIAAGDDAEGRALLNRAHKIYLGLGDGFAGERGEIDRLLAAK